MRNWTKLFYLFPLYLLLISCGEDESPAVEKSILVSDTQLLTRTSGDLRTFLSNTEINFPNEAIEYDVTIYKVEYTASYKGEEITASGLVMLPDVDEPVPMLSFQHGTIVAHNRAPSAQPISSTEWILYAGIAATGYVMVIPDFFGFGSSTSLLHPYYVEEPSATAVVEMIRAAHQFSIEEDVKLSGKLFLAGYSQGGYMTIAAHKAIENEPLTGLELVKSYPAAGGYIIKGVQEYFFSLETYHQPFFIGFVTEAYRSWYDWTELRSLIFQSPYDAVMEDLFDGSLTGNQINMQLTDTLGNLLQPDLLATIDTNSDYAFMVDAFIENGLDDFIPTIPMSLYHGTADITVPYQNSLDYIDYLRDNGVSESLVSFTSVEGGTHLTAVGPYIEMVLDDLTNISQ